MFNSLFDPVPAWVISLVVIWLMVLTLAVIELGQKK